MLNTPTKIVLAIGLIIIASTLYIYFTKDTPDRHRAAQAIRAVTYITKNTGPLETDNMYIEIVPTEGLATSSREKINQTIYQAARSNSCFYAKPFDRKKISAYLNALESDKYIDPDTLDDEALLLRYSTLMPHEAVGDFTTTFNRDGLLSITHTTYNSYCGEDTKSSGGTLHYFTFDLVTGEHLMLSDLINDSRGLQASLQEKISATYDYLKAGVDSENPDTECYRSLIEDSLLLTSSSYLEQITFRLSTDQLELIPQGYPSAIAGVCGGTSIPFRYADIGKYVKPESPLLRLLPTAL